MLVLLACFHQLPLRILRTSSGKTGHWFHSPLTPLDSSSHFKDSMDLTARDTVSVVGTTIHEDFFEPWPSHSQGHSNQGNPHRTTITPCRGRHQKSHQKQKEKPCLGFFLQTYRVVIQGPPVQTLLQSSILPPSKAHRICSVKMAGYSWERSFGKILQLF